MSAGVILAAVSLAVLGVGMAIVGTSNIIAECLVSVGIPACFMVRWARRWNKMCGVAGQ